MENNKFINRKRTRLKYYDYSTSGAYFITICIKDMRIPLLSNIFVGNGALDVPQRKLTSVGKIVDKYIRSTNNIKGISVDKYVIMPNHIHMIIFIDNPDGASKAPHPTNSLLSHTVGTLKRFVNRDIGQNIWQTSFHDHIIRDDNDYLKIWNYIDTNVSRWNKDRFFITTDE
ncbi:MAG: transposase [Clostridia bacterium]|nr:transposase [Clostridia bacterium]